jgi:hypothetical protein
MRTGLWVAASGLAPAALLERVPPTCQRRIDLVHPPMAETSEADVLVEGPEWPVESATYFVPSLAILAETPYSARLELSVRISGAWSPWTAGIGLGPTPFTALPRVEGLDADIDVFRARAPVESARLRLRLRSAEAPAVLAAPWMLTLSASDESPAGGDAAPGGPAVQLEVPTHSQMDADPMIAHRICSPTCVAMVLDFWRHPVRLDVLARDMFSPAVDLYGVWPAAIAAASRRGLAGYVLRFPDWTSAAWCLERGLPIIASVRYADGELTGAAILRTPGHLLTLTGWQGDEVLVNDPAAPAAAVARRYRLDELARVWLERTGIGYVIFPLPDGRLRGG